MFSEIIKQVQEDKRLIPDLMKAENGNNFRAISESAILDVINPILIKNGWFYEIRVRNSELQVKEAYGSKGKKLQFIATITIAIVFHNEASAEDLVGTEAVGMGIDDNDKAMGKAYTYAVKYALLKLFRLRYGDDPDFKASEPLYIEKQKEAISSKSLNKEEKIKPEKEDIKPKSAKKAQKSDKSAAMAKPMTEAQRDYILGLMKQNNVAEKEILEKFGVEPTRDEFIPMPTARAIIKWFEDGEFLPF